MSREYEESWLVTSGYCLPALLNKESIVVKQCLSVCKTKIKYFSYFLFFNLYTGSNFFLYISIPYYASIFLPTHTFQQDCMHFMPVRTADYNVKRCARCHIVLYMYMYCSAWTGAAGLFLFCFEFTMYVLDWIFMSYVYVESVI